MQKKGVFLQDCDPDRARYLAISLNEALCWMSGWCDAKGRPYYTIPGEEALKEIKGLLNAAYYQQKGREK